MDTLPSEPQEMPDLMNDPAFDPDTPGHEKGHDDLDTCRICRGEASSDEPLFYPCKCSGSIKFVHQDCLMEWLSHSQKKYCELCKTPFRFTKLYSPLMPKKLPTSVFVRKALLHLISNIFVWLRGLLVGSVWLIALPWCMRSAWRIVFWFGDAGWARNNFNNELLSGLADASLSTSISANPSITSASASSKTASPIPAYLDIKSQTLNMTRGAPFPFRLAKHIWNRVTSISEHSGLFPPNAYNSTTVDPVMLRMAQQEQSSILSEIPFLKSLSSSSKFNRVVMDVLEGQIITVSVVVAFILIFLIREWVVQQLPVVDMGAADGDNALAQAGGGAQNRAPEAPVPEAENAAETGEPGDAGVEAVGEQESDDDDEPIATPQSDGTQDSLPSQPIANPSIMITSSEQQSVVEPAENLEEAGIRSPARNTGLSDEIEAREIKKQEHKGRIEELEAELKRLSTRKEQLDALHSASKDPVDPVTEDSAWSLNGENGDAASWMSTVASKESYANDDLDLGENPFAEEPHVDEDLATPQDPAIPDRNPSSDQNTAPPAVQVLAHPPNFVGRAFDWFWGDIAPTEALAAAAEGQVVEDQDDEHIVEDIAAEAPFVPFAQAQPLPVANPPPIMNGIINPEVAAGVAQVGVDPNDPDAVEDAEDLEGILELIGMQGPIVGLFQNAIFSAVLIFISVVAAVWVPYLYGKIVLLTTAMPELLYRVPLRMCTMIADLFIDLALILVGYMTYLMGQLYRVCMSLLYVDVTSRYAYKAIAIPALQLAQAALKRLAGGASATADLEAKDFLYLSMGCHAALDGIREAISSILQSTLDGIGSAGQIVSSITLGSIPDLILSKIPQAIIDDLVNSYNTIVSILSNIWNTGAVSIPLGSKILLPDDPMLAYWTATDRTLAVIAGYCAIALAGALYLKIAPITNSARGRRIESQIMEVFQQAGGILKVVLIISIEMIAFPLFCGFLLDFSLMPLFESATFGSRFTFTILSPWTAGFVHWFVGTCYMFHFALFVSMCRRIMRGGVLYFIRDPDDPTFHPVRDVLERNVITQLRKIAFSAIVYGALIVVCLGGVVWTLWAVSDSILPIHWTSSESSIEFPLDILFYNFLTPVIVKLARPSDGLHAMYTWWFRRCARALRLSDFLFRDNYQDEEGHHIRQTWRAWFTRRQGRIEELTSDDDEEEEEESIQIRDAYFQRDGKHVRAPASDQVRIPKGSPVFVEVDEDNNRLDGKPEDEGIHAKNSELVTNVYIPPWFRIRIGLFVVAVWLFAAATGISVTIVPLLFGRKVLSRAISNANNVNDIYAFSLGIYILGGFLYIGIHCKAILLFFHSTFWPSSASRSQALATFGSYIKRTASIIYVYTSLAIGLPLLFAVLLELYILMPIHTTFGQEESHVIHLIQDWTLGILYVRIGTRILMWDRQSRAARTVQAVVRDGYLKPDARLATRAFILPTLIAFVLLIASPFKAALLANATYFRHSTAEEKIKVMRLAYPFALVCVTGLWSIFALGKATERWRMRIRDEVYLIGERLHNFGEKRPGPDSKSKGKSPVVDVPPPAPAPARPDPVNRNTPDADW